MTEQGCPIEDLAKDNSISTVCNQYIEAKQFDFMEGMSEYRNAKFKEYNLEPDLIIELEGVWLRYRQHIRNKNGNH